MGRKPRRWTTLSSGRCISQRKVLCVAKARCRIRNEVRSKFRREAVKQEVLQHCSQQAQVDMQSVMTRTRRRTKGIQRIDLAYAERASSEVARDINRDVVLELIRKRQPISRADLSRPSGLQPSTVSSIVEQLLKEKWISEGPAARRPRGRRPVLLSLNSETVIAVADVRPNQIIMAVVDL